MALIPLNTFKTKTAVLTTSEYNRSTCARDTGLIVDSVAFDLLHGFGQSDNNSTQSLFSGLQYWAQDAIKIPGDVLQTLSALRHADDISQQILSNEIIQVSDSFPRLGNGTPAISQVTDVNNPATDASIKKVKNEYSIVADIIEHGVRGVTNKIAPNRLDPVAIAEQWTPDTEYKFGKILKTNIGLITVYYKVIVNGLSGSVAPSHVSGREINGSTTLEVIPVEQGYYNAANLLLANKELIQEEVAAYVLDTFNNVLFDKEKFIKLTKLTVESLAMNILLNDHSQVTYSGSEFWYRENQIKNASIIDETLAILNRVKDTTINIANNNAIVKQPNNQYSQYIDISNAGNVSSITAVSDLFDLLIGIIDNNTTDVLDLIVPNMQRSSMQGVINTYTLISENISFIRDDVIEWIKHQIDTNTDPFSQLFVFDQIDIETWGKTIEELLYAICIDIAYSGVNQATRQTVQYAMSFFNSTNAAQLSTTEQSKTTTVFNYLSSLMNNIVTGKPVAVTYQSKYQQFVNLPPASNSQAVVLTNSVNTIVSIINSGVSESLNVKNSYDVTIDSLNENAFRLLMANKDFLVAEMTAFLENKTSTSNFVLSGDRLSLCKRDIGFIVDSIVFDLRNGGNRQAVHSGVYYYNHSARTSVIPKERIDTTEAFNHMKVIIDGILRNEKPVITYQTAVKQLRNLDTVDPGSRLAIADNVNSLITMVNRIISAGPTSVTNIEENQMPIKLDITPVDTTNVVRAFNLILENRAYIIAEIIGFLNTKLLSRPTTTKIYTAPPGVTAIVLMAQAANVTDTNKTITFAHYRNIPVFADSATYNGFQAANTVTELVKDFVIPPNNAASLIDGKMIIESFDSIIAYANDNESIKVTLSILETANA